MKVEDIMTADPACCTPDQTLPEIARLMQECDCGEIPVVDGRETRRPVGVVTDRDIVVRAIARDYDVTVTRADDIMSKNPLTVREGTAVSEAREKMEQRQVRRLPVVDADGRICGIVAQADFARSASSRHTAELVKDVSKPGGQPQA